MSDNGNGRKNRFFSLLNFWTGNKVTDGKAAMQGPVTELLNKQQLNQLQSEVYGKNDNVNYRLSPNGLNQVMSQFSNDMNKDYPGGVLPADHTMGTNEGSYMPHLPSSHSFSDGAGPKISSDPSQTSPTITHTDHIPPQVENAYKLATEMNGSGGSQVAHGTGSVHIKPIASSTLPWNFAMDKLHTNISDPKVLSKLTNNSLGITFKGNGLSDGKGAIDSVTVDGHTYTDQGHINGAIKYILDNKTSVSNTTQGFDARHQDITTFEQISNASSSKLDRLSPNHTFTSGTTSPTSDSTPSAGSTSPTFTPTPPTIGAVGTTSPTSDSTPSAGSTSPTTTDVNNILPKNLNPYSGRPLVYDPTINSVTPKEAGSIHGRPPFPSGSSYSANIMHHVDATAGPGNGGVVVSSNPQASNTNPDGTGWVAGSSTGTGAPIAEASPTSKTPNSKPSPTHFGL